MKLPETGRIVVIDDEFNEALPLLNVLARNGTPAVYFSSAAQGLPAAPLMGLRVVFLDLQLVPSTDSKTVCSAIAGTLRKVISKDNGPYLLFVWSKHDQDYLTDAKALFDNGLKDIRPAYIANLEKTTYLQTNGDGTKTFVPNALNLIEAKLKTELAAANAFHLFVMWENAASRAATEIVNEIASLYPVDSNWEANMAGVFRSLAEAREGRQIDQKEQQAMCRAALSTFGEVFADSLERGIACCDYSVLGDIPAGNAADLSIKARINRRLLLAEPQGATRPGDVFSVGAVTKTDVGELFDFRHAAKSYAEAQKVPLHDVLDEKGKVKDAHKKGVDKESERLRGVIMPLCSKVRVEASPVCDWAQRKWTRNRFVCGLLWPAAHAAAIKRADYVYFTPSFEWKGAAVVAALDLRHLCTYPLRKTARPGRMFSFRNELLVDIQQKLGHHISRPGIQFV